MCGIAGLVLSPDAPPPDPAVIAALTRSIAHRGPDGSGHTLVGRVVLVHNRLSIIDLVTGDQPLFAGPAALVANGEIYNYRALRAGMPQVTVRHEHQHRPPHQQPDNRSSIPNAETTTAVPRDPLRARRQRRRRQAGRGTAVVSTKSWDYPM